MINSNLQLISWIASFFVGLVYSHVLELFFKYTSRNCLLIRIIFEFLFTFINIFCLVFLYFKINGGYIHYSFIFFWFFGFFLLLIVKSNVNRQK